MGPFFTVMHLGVGYFWPPCLPAYTCACSPWHSPTLGKSPDPVRQCFAGAMTRLRCQTERRRGQKVKIFGSDSHAPKRLRRVNMQRRRLSSRKSLLWPSCEFRSLSPPVFVSPCVSVLLFLSAAWMNLHGKTLTKHTATRAAHGTISRPRSKEARFILCSIFEYRSCYRVSLLKDIIFGAETLLSTESAGYRFLSNFPAGW